MEGIPYTASYDDVRQFFTSDEEKVTEKVIESKQQDDDDNDVDNDTTTKKLSSNIHIKDIRLPVWNDTGRLRGYGHIVFDTIEYTQYILKTYSNNTIIIIINLFFFSNCFCYHF